MKKIRTGLLGRIFIAMILGVAAGAWLNDAVIRVFVTFNSLFSQLLGFIIPLLILGLVAPAIVEIGKRAGRMLLFTVALAYVATMLAGLMSYGVGATVFPKIISPGNFSEALGSATTLEPYFTITIAPLMTVTSALVLAFILGLCVAHIPSTALRDVLKDFREVIVMLIRNVIVPLLPLYIFGIFSDLTRSGQVVAIVTTFVKVIGVIFAMHIVLLVVQYLIGAAIDRKSPFKCLKLMLPAYFTALGTASSAATIPVTLRQTKEMGVDPPWPISQYRSAPQSTCRGAR